VPYRITQEENKMATTLELNVNGRSQKVSLEDPETPLLWVLRDNLGLMGAKYGCGFGTLSSEYSIDISRARSNGQQPGIV